MSKTRYFWIRHVQLSTMGGKVQESRPYRQMGIIMVRRQKTNYAKIQSFRYSRTYMVAEHYLHTYLRTMLTNSFESFSQYDNQYLNIVTQVVHYDQSIRVNNSCQVLPSACLQSLGIQILQFQQSQSVILELRRFCSHLKRAREMNLYTIAPCHLHTLNFIPHRKISLRRSMAHCNEN